MSDNKPQLIRPRNTMLERLGGRPGVAGKVDEALLKKAEERIAEAGASYPDRVKADLDKLVALANTAATDAGRRADAVAAINLIVHEIRGEGATFGYPLLTKFASSLFKFTDGLTSPNDRQLALIKAHVDVMAVVVKNGIKGDGGPVGAQIEQSLAMAIEKYSTQKA
jgi:hypothetical protein